MLGSTKIVTKGFKDIQSNTYNKWESQETVTKVRRDKKDFPIKINKRQRLETNSMKECLKKPGAILEFWIRSILQERNL